jgi:hypothetical protein
MAMLKSMGITHSTDDGTKWQDNCTFGFVNGMNAQI